MYSPSFSMTATQQRHAKKSLRWEVFPHPPYSPDLVLAYFYISITRAFISGRPF